MVVGMEEKIRTDYTPRKTKTKREKRERERI
jgi:hypothetical protein